MLVVDTYLDKSKIAGIGLFAATEIFPSTTIWLFNPKIDICFDTLEELNLHPISLNQIDNFAYYDSTFKKYVLCGDNARFLNHSDLPNLDDSGSLFTTAREYISPGTELTVDYRSFHTGPLFPK